MKVSVRILRTITINQVTGVMYMHLTKSDFKESNNKEIRSAGESMFIKEQNNYYQQCPYTNIDRGSSICTWIRLCV